MRILKAIGEVIIRYKAWIFFLIVIIIFGYSILIFFDQVGPTSKYDRKPIRITENIMGGDQPAGVYSIEAEYRSKGVISSNKDIEFFIYSVEYNLNKEQIKGSLVGTRNIWPDNITVYFCPDNIRLNDDSLYSINPCTDGVVLLKRYEDNESISYYNTGYDRGGYFKYDIEFVSSGQKAMSISSVLPQVHKEKVFEIEPYNTYLQIELQKYMYILTLLGFVVIIFQIFEFGVKYLKK